MKTPRKIPMLALLLLATSSVAFASEIRDNAGLFGAEAKRQAVIILDRAQQTSGYPTVIETVKSIGDLTISEATLSHEQAEKQKGVFVLIALDEHKIDLVDADKILASNANRSAIQSAFMDSLKKRDFDAALKHGSEAIAAKLATVTPKSAAHPPAGAGGRVRPAGREVGGGSGLGLLLTLGLIVFAVLIGVRILGALFGGGARSAGAYGPPGRPGYGGPGYGGGGGGGFFSGLMGGIGGAVAGNWLYDQFSGRRNNSGYMGGDAGYGGEPSAPQSTEYGDAGGGDWGGGGDAGGGGDWGGGGGGDWGGGGDSGGGGGDWG